MPALFAAPYTFEADLSLESEAHIGTGVIFSLIHISEPV